MKKLIYADDISERLKRVIRIGGKAPDGEHPISAECVLSVLESLPTVDAVPVVRCRDCKHRDRESDFCHGRGWPMQMVPDNDFCNRGERKDGEHETD